MIDCIRDPDHAASIVTEGDGTTIPGNANIDARERARRRRENFDPYHAAIASALDGAPATRLVSLQSFTPTMQGRSRPCRVGVLHREDSVLSRQVLGWLRAQLGDPMVGDNAAYCMGGADFTVPHH